MKELKSVYSNENKSNLTKGINVFSKKNDYSGIPIARNQVTLEILASNHPTLLIGEESQVINDYIEPFIANVIKARESLIVYDKKEVLYKKFRNFLLHHHYLYNIYTLDMKSSRGNRLDPFRNIKKHFENGNHSMVNTLLMKVAECLFPIEYDKAIKFNDLAREYFVLVSKYILNYEMKSISFDNILKVHLLLYKAITLSKEDESIYSWDEYKRIRELQTNYDLIVHFETEMYIFQEEEIDNLFLDDDFLNYDITNRRFAIFIFVPDDSSLYESVTAVCLLTLQNYLEEKLIENGSSQLPIRLNYVLEQENRFKYEEIVKFQKMNIRSCIQTSTNECDNYTYYYLNKLTSDFNIISYDHNSELIRKLSYIYQISNYDNLQIASDEQLLLINDQHEFKSINSLIINKYNPYHPYIEQELYDDNPKQVEREATIALVRHYILLHKLFKKYKVNNNKLNELIKNMYERILDYYDGDKGTP